MKKSFNKSFSSVFYWLLMLVLLCLFFTNDFGLVDIHKTAIVTAVGIDAEEGELQVTAQIAVPKPSQSGGNIQYVNVQGSGVTVADALSEINAKTGFYPKLFFCKLILLGESCGGEQIFDILDYFYLTENTELTADVAMCGGSASDIFTLPAPAGDSVSESVQRILSDEPEKSANVSSASLKDIALLNYSKSAACYMPYVEFSKAGTSESGGNGDSVGGDQSTEQGGESSSSGENSGQAQNNNVDFFCRRTALFSEGTLATLLDERQAFALNLIESDIRLAVLPCDSGGRHYTLGLKNISASTDLKVKDGVPRLEISFSAKARVQDSSGGSVYSANGVETVPQEVCKAAEDELQERFQSLISACVSGNCDALGLKEQLYKHSPRYFPVFSDTLLSRMQISYNITVTANN